MMQWQSKLTLNWHIDSRLTWTVNQQCLWTGTLTEQTLDSERRFGELTFWQWTNTWQWKYNEVTAPCGKVKLRNNFLMYRLYGTFTKSCVAEVYSRVIICQASKAYFSLYLNINHFLKVFIKFPYSSSSKANENCLLVSVWQS